MPYGRKLIVDRKCDMLDLLEPAADEIFDNLAELSISAPAIVVFHRDQYLLNQDLVKSWMDRSDLTLILCCPDEGSETIIWHLDHMGLTGRVKSGQLLLITGADLPPEYRNLKFQNLCRRTVNSNDLVQCNDTIRKIFEKPIKPYDFLFLNGRTRRHRKYLLERFEQWGLLSRALWTCLEGWGYYDKVLTVPDSEENLMLNIRPIQYLPPQYELPEIRERVNLPLPMTDSFVKHHLFDGVWRDGVVCPAPYVDTYFSVVTETVFDGAAYTFLTEKIFKPIMAGHPFIVSANAGFYKELRRAGFRTFGHVIDESFDSLDNHQDRIERLAQSVRDLCNQNLADFLSASADVCKYNQQHLIEYVSHGEQEFLHNFFQFLSKHQ